MSSRRDLDARIQRGTQFLIANGVLSNERMADEVGLRSSDLQTLHLLSLRPELQTPGEIAAASGLPTSTVTRVLDRLSAGGWLTRTPDPADRRRVRIELDAGRMAGLTRRYDRYADAMRGINATFSAQELETVARYFETITTAAP